MLLMMSFLMMRHPHYQFHGHYRSTNPSESDITKQDSHTRFIKSNFCVPIIPRILDLKIMFSAILRTCSKSNTQQKM